MVGLRRIRRNKFWLVSELVVLLVVYEGLNTKSEDMSLLHGKIAPLENPLKSLCSVTHFPYASANKPAA
jgi:hypothetical protein